MHLMRWTAAAVLIGALAACGTGGGGVVSAASGPPNTSVAAPAPVASSTGATLAASPSSSKEPAVCNAIDRKPFIDRTGATKPFQHAPDPKTLCDYGYINPDTQQAWTARVEHMTAGDTSCSGAGDAENLYFVVTPRTTAHVWREADEGVVVVYGTVCSPKYLANFTIDGVPLQLAEMRDIMIAQGKRLDKAA